MHPMLSAMSVMDRDMEARALAHIDVVGGSNEYDGVVFFCTAEAAKKKQELLLAETGLHSKIKPYEHPVTLAMTKHPSLCWFDISPVPSTTWTEALLQVLSNIKEGPAVVRSRDQCVSLVLRGCWLNYACISP